MTLKLTIPRENTDEMDFSGVAIVGILIGAILTLAGLMAQHPVLMAMAEAFGVKRTVAPVQCLVAGAILLASSTGFYAWCALRAAKRLRSDR